MLRNFLKTFGNHEEAKLDFKKLLVITNPRRLGLIQYLFLPSQLIKALIFIEKEKTLAMAVQLKLQGFAFLEQIFHGN